MKLTPTRIILIGAFVMALTSCTDNPPDEQIEKHHRLAADSAKAVKIAKK